ncbi:hypothetical protein [Mycolicibacterium arenosum]|uniref:Uncharacterized protein n=1 Tax=Mycolicibacterium arenosum TaxID=2952157 RepID=A0ABT1LYV0_9MYCO|nr:hypothetical protein [Mycolicibacterium sp. CAU 1645]MCP9272079.1 hypothetical protein [Mycolicibacterium sp. CAU 1645]
MAKTTANTDGDFTTQFSTGTTPAGQHSVQAVCGPTLNALLDIVLVSEVGTQGPAVVMIMLFLLVFGWVLLRGGAPSKKGSVR